MASYQCGSLSFFRITQLPSNTSMGAFEGVRSLPSEFSTTAFAASLWEPQANDNVAITAENKVQTVLELVGLPASFADTVAENGAIPSGGVVPGFRTYPAAPAANYTFSFDSDGIVDAFLATNLPATNAWRAAALFYLNTAEQRYHVVYAIYRKSGDTGNYRFYGFEAEFSVNGSGESRRRLLAAGRVDRASISASQRQCNIRVPTPPGCMSSSCRVVCD